MVPSTSDEQTPVCYDPHDYDEVPMEEMSRSPPQASTGGYATVSPLPGTEHPVLLASSWAVERGGTGERGMWTGDEATSIA